MKPLSRNLWILAGLIILVFAATVFSIAAGAKYIPFETVAAWMAGRPVDEYEAAVIASRLPRTFFGLAAGAALGVSGTLMQAITRNPVADPSILGVNSGAALAVVISMTFLHVSSINLWILLAFAGGFAAAVLVYTMASAGYQPASPLKLALAGSAMSIALSCLVSAIILPDANAMDKYRFWQVGSLGSASWNKLAIILPYLLAGFIIAWIISGHLNVLALGDETASGLGAKPEKIRAAAALSGVLLAASVTALAGPIAFVGLMVPHFLRLLTSSSYEWLIPLSALSGAVLLVFCDVLGRISGGAGEIEVGIITALIGAPVFIAVVRKVKVQGL